MGHDDWCSPKCIDRRSTAAPPYQQQQHFNCLCIQAFTALGPQILLYEPTLAAWRVSGHSDLHSDQGCQAKAPLICTAIRDARPRHLFGLCTCVDSCPRVLGQMSVGVSALIVPVNM
eukprot:1161268-Pelagomonas_calceolata.AAC.5